MLEFKANQIICNHSNRIWHLIHIRVVGGSQNCCIMVTDCKKFVLLDADNRLYQESNLNFRNILLWHQQEASFILMRMGEAYHAQLFYL